MTCDYLSPERLQELCDAIHETNICLIGDICMDFYWFADMKRSRLSRETPHFPLPVVRETASPGAAGNVMNNIHALGPKTLSVVSCVADDWRGQAVLSWMEKNGIDTGFIHHRIQGVTPAYCKPMKAGISNVVYEDPRIDFENTDPLWSADEDAVIAAIDRAAAGADIIVVSDQFSFGVVTDRIREHICGLGKEKTVVVDSRDRIGLYTNVILKPNELEAARVVQQEYPSGMTEDDCLQVAAALRERSNSAVIVTAGDRGAVWCDSVPVLIPTIKAEPPVDIVGAGDTFLSAFACAYAAVRDGEAAVMFGNLASGVTVKKIGTTGTASPEEIRSLYENTYEKKPESTEKSPSTLKKLWSTIHERL